MKTLAQVIRCEILEHGGVLPFDRFMELALYCPKLGYYEAKTDSIGRRGDFYTSVSVGNLFGELLAFQFADWLEGLKAENFKLVEAGAHDGKLAADILSWLQSNRPDLFDRVEYCVIEPSARRMEWQRETLKNFAEKVRWLSGFNPSGNHKRVEATPRRLGEKWSSSGGEAPPPLWEGFFGGEAAAATLPPFHGILFSNELLDAFPVRRLGWNAKEKKWFEWSVAANGEKFAWTKIEEIEDGLPTSMSDFTSSLSEVLPDNFTTETHPTANNWWRRAASSLKAGKLMTVDYGLTDEEFFLPSRKNGTLRAFFRHHFADDLLANPGEQDLTAHVNFSELQRIGEEMGLKTDFFGAQTKFLTGILEKISRDKNFGEWTSARVRQFQTLTHPEHLGRAFRALVQSR